MSLIANKVGPFANPSETYAYFSLPFCTPDEVEHQSHGLGEILAGDRKVKTLYEINFMDDVPWRRLCKRTLTEKEINTLALSVDEEYFFEMFLDELPMWGYVGDSDKETDLILSPGVGFTAAQNPHKYVYTHLHFNIAYNGGSVIAVNLTANPTYRFDVSGHHHNDDHKEGMHTQNAMDTHEIEYSYSVKWEKTDVTFENRMKKYEKVQFLPASFEIHWLSIINAFVLVILLTVFMAVILMQVLKNDFTRYLKDVEEDFQEEETGWKLVASDVFRYPSHKLVFCAMLGSGSQLLCMLVLLLGLALMSFFTPSKRGALATATVVAYALTSGIGGYVAGRMYEKFEGKNWVWNTVLTATLFPAPLLVSFAFLNSVAVGHGSTAALPAGTIGVIFALYALVTFPLTVLGGIIGRKSAGPFDAPCRTNKVPREIPLVPWYRSMMAQLFCAGFLPFSAIYIEFYTVSSGMCLFRSFYCVLFSIN